jgi:chromosome segregation ATPase
MKRAAVIGLFLAIGLSAGAHAQTLEQQLRSQLADARSQLQDLQGQQAQWQLEKSKLEQERDGARKEADTAKAQLSKRNSAPAQDTAALSAERTARAQAEAEVQRLQKALADANAKAHAQEQQGTDLTTQLSETKAQVATCTARNQQLYQIGNEILDAYSHMSVGRVIASREPFAASERVKLDNAAQAYGDKLYEQRFDPRAEGKKP